ncbi:hypothetical protein IEU95_04740 [Hoyosella rhizosphaerae]|uniref:Acyltransferase n=1 Tax=Hoyosella rhizosphaerae TaxID=1755582 RepID=A0A916UAS7_9ACTN|nr:condensation domain-containing protein [Hoyosella rhizosphaerae]MBN4926124.1 hypothetical protein [Hoyosella rhizosphaerae]GGC65384.1 acyltransferase [Hoyosella rhizosphaerae]
MILGALSRWNPYAGTPIDVTFTVTPHAAPEQHPVSFLQRDHLTSARTSAARSSAARSNAARPAEPYRAYIGGLTRIDHPLDTTTLASAISDFIATHENTRTWFDYTDNNFTRLVASTSDVAIDIKRGDNTDGPQLIKYVEDRLSTECEPWSPPCCAFGAIDHGDHFTLYYAADHAITDGISHGLAINEIAQRYLAHTTNSTFTYPVELAQPHSTFTQREYDAATNFAGDTAAQQQWADLFAAGGWRIPRFPLNLGLDPGETAPVRIVENHLLTSADADAFEHVCAAHDTRPSGAIFAALALAEHELAGNTTYFGLTVLSTRAPENALSQGWFCNFVPVTFPVPQTPNLAFTHLLQPAQQAFNTAKTLAGTPVHAAISTFVAAGKLAPPTQTPQMVNYLDTRRVPGSNTSPHDNALIFTGEGRTANANMWVVRTNQGLFLNSQTPNTPYAQEVLATYFQHIKTIFTAVAHNGDYVSAGRAPAQIMHHPQ